KYSTAPYEFDVTWDGPALTFGETYYVTVRVEDAFNVASPEAGRTNTLPSHAMVLTDQGYMTVTAPLGKLETLTPPAWSGTFGNVTGDVAEFATPRLLRREASGAYVVVATGNRVDVGGVPVGAAISLTHEESGLPDLEWGKGYAV